MRELARTGARLRSSAVPLLACALGAVAIAAAGCGDDENDEAAGGAATQQERVTLKMQTTAPAEDLWTQMLDRFADGVDEATDGQITVEVFCCGQLVSSTTDELGAVQSGQLSGVAFTNGGLTSFDDRATAFSLPFVAQTHDGYFKILDGPGIELWESILGDQGIVAIPGASSNQGFRQITNSVRPLTKPEDFEGLDIRAPQIELYTDVFTELGANPISIVFNDLPGALEQGAADGQENPLTLIRTAGFQKLQDYMTIWNWSASSLNFGFNKELWDSLTPEQQDIVTAEAVEAAHWHREALEQSDDESLEAMRGEFERIDTLTDAQLEVFRTAIAPVIDKWSETIGPEITEEFYAAGAGS